MPEKRNVYTHQIELKHLRIDNQPREQFRKLLEEVEYLGYEVEQLVDGRRIVVTKPGGKFTYGTIRREDFMVWVHDPRDSTLWLITHENMYDDLAEKGAADPRGTIDLIGMLEEVYGGGDPDDILARRESPVGLPGEPPDLLLKAYKWIWGQEDSNYPEGKGRAMSWEGWAKR